MSRDAYTTVKGAAEQLEISERTIRRSIAAGHLTAYRIGPRSIRIKTADLTRLLAPMPSASVN